MEKDIGRKWEFLGALYKHGSNPKLLKGELGWTDEQIKVALKSYRNRAARQLKKQKETSLSMWHDLVLNCHQIESASEGNDSDERCSNYSFLLHKAMLAAACFEEHYQSENPDEPNYNEIYRYLAQLLAGEEPKQLRPGSAKKILEMMSKMNQLLESKESVQRYLNYIKTQHSVSYLKPDVDVWSIVHEKKQKKDDEHEQENELARLFKEPETSQESLSELDKNDSQYLIKKEKIILKLSLKQRALAETLIDIPGMNPLEMVLPSLVKPPSSLVLPNSNPKKRKHKGEDE